ncbi:site-2 protease family protein [Terasakiella pusilla]|uniref:site-2 protease family protein n=1 Tax=Terasakiella pusilla TaxID=64973 RepID=UPI0006902104|nr:site-2 protease family protein [Terasakiella pusilla]
MGNTDLPPLREDLLLKEGPTDFAGAPTWSIYDPAKSRYLRLNAVGFEIIRHWKPGPIVDVLERINSSLVQDIHQDDVMSLLVILTRNEFLMKSGREGIQQLKAHHDALNVAWYKKFLHHYLFFKVPLIHPDRFLQQSKRYTDVFYQPVFYMGMLALGLVGLFLLLREWTQFTRTVPDMFSFQNALWGMVALGLSKILHEFAHAYTAARFNCRVPTMGVAFMVMWPVLYTDMSDTWRLNSRKERLLVASAGMISELILALLATLLWTLLPESGLKDATFILATIAWVMTLAINLNPFMRFDGYYIFSDLLGIENLQDRSFALAKWRMREWFLGLGAPPPESFPKHLKHILVIYAFFTWVYRLLLFLGIALLVYFMFFKVLGIFLMAVELIFFIGKPIWTEIKVWWSLRKTVGLSKAALRSLFLVLALILFLAVPWQKSIQAPAFIRSAQYTQVFPPISGQLRYHALVDGKSVLKGEKLLEIYSPELEYEIQQSQRRLQAKQVMLKRLGTNRAETERWPVVLREIREEKTRLDGLINQQEQLIVRAPHQGVVYDISPHLHSQRWLSKEQSVFRLVNTEKQEILAYVGERDYHRLRKGETARFTPKNVYSSSVELKIVEVAQVNTNAVEHPALIEKFGGQLAAREIGKGLYTPTEGIYKIRLEPIENLPSLDQVTFGSVSLPVRQESILKGFIDTMGAVLIRESGF